ncbi:MAG TPA: efflux RND transporter periplasmic adaptor subunit [Holophagaceae bacterium]|nr:efflux RND transporter periplasmic adaptor subunit [Holophagaceae bacterium]
MTPTESTYPSMRKFGTGILVACGLTALGIATVKHSARSREAGARAKALAEGPLVKVQPLALSSGERKLTLQGEALPYASTTLYAKVSGFLRTMAVDKGDRVRAGQVMGILQSPEVEQDYVALKADADTKRANARRAAALGKDQLLSARDVEQAESDARVAEAKLASQATLKGYQVLRAPFDGVVTARFADPGALVQNAANGASGAQPLVTVAQIQKLRVNLYLDQRIAGAVKVGTPVALSPADRPDLVVPAKVTRLSGALDVRTRTMLAEVELDNRKGDFLPGGFIAATLALKVPPRLELPVEALVMKGDKAFAATLGPDGRVALKPVQVGAEEAGRLPVSSGLQAGEKVILNPGDAAKDGAKVRVAAS